MFHSKVVTNNKGNKSMTSYYLRGSVIWLNYYVDGVRKQKTTKLKNTPKNILIVENHIIPALNIKISNGDIYKKKPKTFEYYGDIFLKQKSDDKNYIQMKRFYDKVLNKFIGIDIDRITRLDIKEYLLSLDIKSKNPYKTVIISVFELAVDDGVISVNPALNIRMSKTVKKEVEYFSKKEVNKIFETVPHGLLRVYLMIAFNTGLRSGEILGLQLGDFDKSHITIRRTRTQGQIGKGKNKYTYRKVPYPSFLLDEVKSIQSNNIFIFDNIDDSSKLNYMWFKYLKLANLKRLRLYCTRHTFSTLMLQDKILSINELAGVLGHSSVKTTLDKYASVISPDSVTIDSNFSLYCDDTVTVKNRKLNKAL